MRTHLKTALAIAAIATFALTGCQTDEPDESGLPSLDTSETPTPSPEPSDASETPTAYEEATTEEQAVADASASYIAYWALVDAVFAARGDGAEQLQQWATPGALAFAEEQIALARDNDLTVEGSQTITVLDGGYASSASGNGTEQAFGHVVFEACHSESTRTITTADGQVVEAGEGGSVVNAELIRDPSTGAWIVTIDQLAGATC